MSTTTVYKAKTIDLLTQKFVNALESLNEAKPFAKSAYQTDVFQIAETLMQSDAGIRILYQEAKKFDSYGVFLGGPWENKSRLQPPLVSGGLKASGVYPVVEILSELRMLALAKGDYGTDEEQEFARDFLREVLALNLEYLFPSATEEARITAGPHFESAVRLFAIFAEELDLSSLLDQVVSEIEQICAQRPIISNRVIGMIELAGQISADDNETARQRLSIYQRAVSGPSKLTETTKDPAAYREILRDADRGQLETEAQACAHCMNETGLVSSHHAVLLRRLRSQAPDLIPLALGLSDKGSAEFMEHQEYVQQLIRGSIFPTTAQTIYGLSKILEFGLLSRREVKTGLTRIIDLDIHPEVRRRLLAQRTKRDGITANSILLAGVISVFGQPLGIGQGHNPTCQAARGISLWAQHAHGYLLKLIISAARDGFVEMQFEGKPLRSDKQGKPLPSHVDVDMDAVSIALVPHLDRLYEAMMGLVAIRLDDGHKWVNPALYGRWVPRGFASVFADRAQTLVSDYDEFVRRFYATHHPAYNEGHVLMYPNPVGLLVTNSHGDYLGPHAVSLLRIAHSPDGELRAYFYNPNNEGRQNWGFGVKPTVKDNGEREGESSLPFHHFASRIYAFHYNPYEEGEAYAVPIDTVTEIEEAAKKSWGQSFTWT